MKSNKQNWMNKLNDKVTLTLKFIQEKLRSRRDVNQNLLDEYESLLVNFNQLNLDSFQEKLALIKYRPSPEGAKVDYTEGISLDLKHEHKSLMEYLNEIEDLIIKARV